MKFRCDCHTHLLVVEDFSHRDIPGLSLAIYDIYSPKGRKYKKPKLTGDVVILNNSYKREYTKLVNYIYHHSTKKSLAERYIKP